MLHFTKRAAVRVTDTARIRTWRALDAPFVVEKIESLYGLTPRVLLIQRLANGNEAVISRHRKTEAARKAAERMARRAG